MKTLAILFASMLLLGSCHQQVNKNEETEIKCDSTVEPNNDGILVDLSDKRTYQITVVDTTKQQDKSILCGLLITTDSVTGIKDSLFVDVNWEYQELILEKDDQILDILSEGGSGHIWMMTKVDLKRKKQISCQEILFD